MDKPTTGAPITIMIKGMWALHLLAGCCEKEKREKSKQNKNNQAKTTTEVKPAICFNAATTTIKNVSNSK